MGFLSGKVNEPTTYVPVPKGRYSAVIAVAEVVDPVQQGWTPDEELSEEEKAEFLRPFPRLRWKIEGLESGTFTDYTGRMVDQRLSLRSGVNPKTGRSYAEGRADLIRLRNGLSGDDEVVGYTLFEDGDLGGLTREEAVALANQRMKQYEGLRGIVRVIHVKSKKDDTVRDSVGKIVLPKRSA